MLVLSPSAERYRQLRESGRVKDGALFVQARQPAELELQARWFAGDFGKRFRSVCGKEIEIVQFGTWNREAGPDFFDAVIRVDAGEVTRCSIEFDLTDRSWEAHGHATSAAFEDTILHVFVHAGGQTFFTRTKSHRNVLQVRVDFATLSDAFSSNVPLARPGRCQAPLKNLPAERVRSIIEAAARFRLQRKAARLRTMLETHGQDEALFHEVAAALGYKQNKLPFTLLAQRLPLSVARSRKEAAEALFFGLAGFLQAADLSIYEDETRGYVRGLWDRWWPRRDEVERLVLPAELWRFSGARPLNHPQRRLAALALLAQNWSAFSHSLDASDPDAGTREFLCGLEHPFWNLHYTLTSKPAAKTMALIGDSRAAEILANRISFSPR